MRRIALKIGRLFPIVFFGLLGLFILPTSSLVTRSFSINTENNLVLLSKVNVDNDEMQEYVVRNGYYNCTFDLNGGRELLTDLWDIENSINYHGCTTLLIANTTAEFSTGLKKPDIVILANKTELVVVQVEGHLTNINGDSIPVNYKLQYFFYPDNLIDVHLTITYDKSVITKGVYLDQILSPKAVNKWAAATGTGELRIGNFTNECGEFFYTSGQSVIENRWMSMWNSSANAGIGFVPVKYGSLKSWSIQQWQGGKHFHMNILISKDTLVGAGTVFEAAYRLILHNGDYRYVKNIVTESSLRPFDLIAYKCFPLTITIHDINIKLLTDCIIRLFDGNGNFITSAYAEGGTVNLTLVKGNYTIEVFCGNRLINQTSIGLDSSQNITIQTSLSQIMFWCRNPMFIAFILIIMIAFVDCVYLMGKRAAIVSVK